MTLLQKLLFENANNSENINNILLLAKECADYVKDNNDYVDSIDIENNGKVNYSFTQKGLDVEDAASLYQEANSAFLDEFNNRARMELSEVF